MRCLSLSPSCGPTEFSFPISLQPPPRFFPFPVMQLEAGCLEWHDNLTSSFNLMFYMCFRAKLEIDSSSWSQL